MQPRFVILAASLALAACQLAEEEAPSRPPTAENPDEPELGVVTSPAELAGEYRIAGVDGDDINLPYGISATIDETTIRVSADCLSFGWTYRFDNSRLVTETVPAASCRRGLLPLEEAVRAAFDAAQAIRRTPANGIEFSGGGHSVTLFSQ